MQQEFNFSKPNTTGTLKSGYISKSGKKILLIPMMRNRSIQEQIIRQVQMMKYIKQKQIPTVSQVSLYTEKNHFGILQQYIPEATIFTPSDI